MPHFLFLSRALLNSSLDRLTAIRARAPSSLSLWSRDFFRLRSQLRTLIGLPAASPRPSSLIHTHTLSLSFCMPNPSRFSPSFGLVISYIGLPSDAPVRSLALCSRTYAPSCKFALPSGCELVFSSQRTHWLGPSRTLPLFTDPLLGSLFQGCAVPHPPDLEDPVTSRSTCR